MGFLDVLRVWGDDPAKRVEVMRGMVPVDLDNLGGETAANPQAMSAPPLTTSYDREQWRKKLKRVLEDYEPPPRPISIVYPHARLLPARTRVFVDWMKRELSNLEA